MHRVYWAHLTNVNVSSEPISVYLNLRCIFDVSQRLFSSFDLLLLKASDDEDDHVDLDEIKPFPRPGSLLLLNPPQIPLDEVGKGEQKRGPHHYDNVYEPRERKGTGEEADKKNQLNGTG